MTKRFISKLYNDIEDGEREGAKIQERIRWTAGALILLISCTLF